VWTASSCDVVDADVLLIMQPALPTMAEVYA
jgi:hypothetical protein